MGDAQVNYLASTVYAVLTIFLLAAVGINLDVPVAMAASVVAAGCAWASAYLGSMACQMWGWGATRTGDTFAFVSKALLFGAVAAVFFGAAVVYPKLPI